jgi:hypothetical protein
MRVAALVIASWIVISVPASLFVARMFNVAGKRGNRSRDLREAESNPNKKAA